MGVCDGPGRRTLWQVGLTSVEVIAAGDRRGVGATNDCLHGAGVSVGELLDWRPYDYLTVRNSIPTPMGLIRLLETTEFPPAPRADGPLAGLSPASWRVS